jgi:hypothetical protein
MKMFSMGLLLTAAGLLMLPGCVDSQGVTDPTLPVTFNTWDVPTAVYPIWAGQSNLAGNLTITNDEDFIYVTYTLLEDWSLLETHLHIAADLGGIPKNPAGIPVPGQFDYSMQFDPPASTCTYTIPLENYGFQCGDQIVVAAHAALQHWDEQGGVYEQETGWGGDDPGPGPRWWYYALYTITCGGGGGPQYESETAWARMYDDPDDFTYELPGANWATYLRLTPSETPETFYFYAGQHFRVGEVYIWKDADWIFVEADLDGEYEMEEAHLNIQLDVGLIGTAPGQYPWKEEFDPFTGDYTFQVAWDPAWNDAELCVALHGVVWGEYPED